MKKVGHLSLVGNLNAIHNGAKSVDDFEVILTGSVNEMADGNDLVCVKDLVKLMAANISSQLKIIMAIMSEETAVDLVTKVCMTMVVEQHKYLLDFIHAAKWDSLNELILARVNGKINDLQFLQQYHFALVEILSCL